MAHKEQQRHCVFCAVHTGCCAHNKGRSTDECFLCGPCQNVTSRAKAVEWVGGAEWVGYWVSEWVS
jgi:hypothetical protein